MFLLPHFILFFSLSRSQTATQVGLKVAKYPILASSCDICFSCFSFLSMDIRDAVYYSQKL